MPYILVRAAFCLLSFYFEDGGSTFFHRSTRRNTPKNDDHVGFLLGLVFNPEGGGNMLLRNVG
jgi:hypothetical protein